MFSLASLEPRGHFKFLGEKKPDHKIEINACWKEKRGEQMLENNVN